MVDVALLGCGGGMPIPERYLSSFLINYRGRKILIDCGEGTQVSMKILGCGFKTIDIICITHGHGDHTVGLPGLLATIGNSGRTELLTIIGPEGIKNIVEGLRVIVPYLPYELNIIENPSEPLYINLNESLICITASNYDKHMKNNTNDNHIDNCKIDKIALTLFEKNKYEETNSSELNNLSLSSDLIISTLEVEHSAPCLGFSFYIKRKPKFNVESACANKVPKILWNKLQKGTSIEHKGSLYEPWMVLGSERKGIKISYITDTRPIDTIPKFIANSDLFICEGTYGDDEDIEKAIKNKHMTFREAASLGNKGDVKELMLTHFSPAMASAKMYINNATEVFPNTLLGEDRLVKTLSFND
ncbi:ribonuclease Z [Clostridium sp.]|uniref:ribonuclease Z n=1 Tax=Clostridium sp. TaxID=1506 RepID=UPI002FCBF22F